VSERFDFVRRAEAGESITELCAEFGISRRTGHKFINRYREGGLEGLKDESRAPKRIPHRTPPEVVEIAAEAKRKHPSWGPKKIKAWVEAKNEGLRLPSASTIGCWLKHRGLVKVRRRPREAGGPLTPSRLTQPTGPNKVWCADYKGQFQLASGKYCFPLTITDQFSRFLVACTALESTKTEPARLAFEEAFREFGLPEIIRTDNGTPFASCGLAGLSALSAWWLQLGIKPERIEPAHPEQNGQHERMHLTLKQETTRPAGANMLQQQERFDDFRETFNEERPHEALGQRPPATLYEASTRRYEDAPTRLTYPLHDVTAKVYVNGFIKFRRKALFLTKALEGHYVGLREVQDGRWLVSFATLELGHYDQRTRAFSRIQEVLPMCPVYEDSEEERPTSAETRA
jgi:putative transposase